MKKLIIIAALLLTPLLWRGAGGEVFAQEINVTNDSVNATVKNIPNQITKDSVVQFANKFIDSIAGKKITDNIIAQSTTIQQLYKKLAEDSIAQSNEIRQLYNKITENAITQSNAIQQLYNKIKEDSIAQSHLLSPKEIASDSLLLMEKVHEGRMRQQGEPVLSETDGGRRYGGNKTKKSSIEQPTLTFDAGQVFSTFKFIDSQGNQPKELTHNRSFGFSLGYRYPLPNGLFIRTNIGLRKAGASMIYEGLNINWNIQYADANIGLGYMYNKWRLKPYFSVSPYFGYMLKANQLIGAFNYDIKEIKSMKTTDFGLFFSPGLKIVLSKSIAFYVEYKYILGLKNLETATDKKSTNRGWAINLGVAITVESLKTIKFVK
jgi:hypothetical protein